MIGYLIVLFMVCMLATKINKLSLAYGNVNRCISRNPQAKVCFLSINTLLILFAGLRTSYNDTYLYIDMFKSLDMGLELEAVLPNAGSAGLNILPNIGSVLRNGGFIEYQMLIKEFISANPQWFLLISAFITTYCFLRFIKRHSIDFGASVFLFGIGFYLASMAGLKQCLAMAWGLCAIEGLYEKGYIKAAIFMLIAVSFHAIVICFVTFLWLDKNVWDKRTIILMVVITIAFGFMSTTLGLLETFYKGYDISVMEGHTINGFRVLVEAVPVVLSFYYKDRIRRAKDPLLIAGVNMQTISFLFIFLSLFYNPIYLGRMASYFSVLECVITPYMLKMCFADKRNHMKYIKDYYVFCFVYMLMEMTKVGSISIFMDQFNQANILNLFF